MSKTLEELEAEFIAARDAFYSAQQEDALKKYGHLIGKWIEILDIPWEFEQDSEDYAWFKNTRHPKFVLVNQMQKVSPMSSCVDRVCTTPAKCLTITDSGFSWNTNCDDECFYTNRYKVVDADYVANELKKVTLGQIELTNKVIKEITQ